MGINDASILSRQAELETLVSDYELFGDMTPVRSRSNPKKETLVAPASLPGTYSGRTAARAADSASARNKREMECIIQNLQTENESMEGENDPMQSVVSEAKCVAYVFLRIMAA